MFFWLIDYRYKQETRETYNSTEFLQQKDNTPSSFFIQLVGMDEIAETHYTTNLLVADLAKQNVVCVGDVQSFNSLQTLDLSHNLFNSCDHIVQIIQAFPSLSTLILNHNPIESCFSEDNFSLSSQLHVFL